MVRPLLVLLLLDGLADDLESVESLCAGGLAGVSEMELLDAVRACLAEDLIQAFDVADGPVELLRNSAPATDVNSLRSYWFGWTAQGERVWREGHGLLDAHHDQYPRDP